MTDTPDNRIRLAENILLGCKTGDGPFANNTEAALASATPVQLQQQGSGEPKPTVVCLCGSSKHPDLHMRVMMDETLAGRIVIPMGLYGHADFPPGAKAATNDGDESTAVKQMLDKLHHRKIDAADEILVVRVAGYIGSSTSREIAYAEQHGKRVRFYDVPHPAPDKPDLRERLERLREPITKAYYEGVEAHAGYASFLTNPYPEGSEQHKLWCHGWREARRVGFNRIGDLVAPTAERTDGR